jgi:hypothetical protein
MNTKRFNLLLKNIHINVGANAHNDFFLHNTWVLYFFFIVSLAYVFYLSLSQNVVPICIFILVGFLISFFSQNMIVILFSALVFTHLYEWGNLSTVEGFTNEEDEDKELEDKEDEDKELEDKELEDKELEDKELEDEDKPTEKKETKSPTPTLAKKKQLSGFTDKEDNENLSKIQEQTQALLNTHNELIKNIELLQPFLKQADSFTQSISKIMK